MATQLKPVAPVFGGFSKQTIKFLKSLAANNDREWFEAHRDAYLAHYIEPAQALVLTLGPRLAKLSPGLEFDPNHTGRGSIKKIHFDQRFVKDRPPFKTWLDLVFWQGPLKTRKDNSVFFLRLLPDKLVLGAGLKHFERPVLKAYRAAVDDSKQGSALKRVMDKLGQVKDIELPQAEYKQVPRGFDPDHPRGLLLRNGSAFVFTEMKLPTELYSAELIDFALARYREMAPLHKWCVKLLAGAEV